MEDFGWDVQEINGHNFQEIHKSFNLTLEQEKPSNYCAHH